MLEEILGPLQGFFGTQGLSIFDPGDLKMPHLRNVYDKVGLFGLIALNTLGNDGAVLGDQIRGFGLGHGGSIGDVETFLSIAGFVFPDGPAQKSAVEDFVLAFPSNLAPIVGQQVTRRVVADPEVDARIEEMAAENRVEPARLSEAWGEAQLRALAGRQLADRKALDFLTAGAKVVESTDS